MTQSPAVRTTGPSGPVRIGERAARTLAAELARHNDPKAALLVGAAPGVRGARRGDRRAAAGRPLTVVPAERRRRRAARARRRPRAAGSPSGYAWSTRSPRPTRPTW